MDLQTRWPFFPFPSPARRSHFPPIFLTVTLTWKSRPHGPIATARSEANRVNSPPRSPTLREQPTEAKYANSNYGGFPAVKTRSQGTEKSYCGRLELDSNHVHRGLGNLPSPTHPAGTLFWRALMRVSLGNRMCLGTTQPFPGKKKWTGFCSESAEELDGLGNCSPPAPREGSCYTRPGPVALGMSNCQPKRSTDTNSETGPACRSIGGVVRLRDGRFFMLVGLLFKSPINALSHPLLP